MNSSHPPPDRGNVLGVNVSAIDLRDATDMLERWIAEGRREYVCVTGVHGVMECRRDPSLREIHNEAGMVAPDGMPVVHFLRLIGKNRTRRVYGPELMREMTLISARRGYRQFYYGGGAGLAEKLKEVLVRSAPGLQVAGTLCPPFRAMTPVEDRAVIDAINAARPHIVWVGLSTPKQERWMAGMQRHALEWLFRLCSEPRRLWRRYAYIVPGFAFLATRELLRRAVGSQAGPHQALTRNPH
jgi:N-acetylglucosaminyldiphosphoundecaprenol N-acetyl-beta-D-mannosaminyltransferase